MDLLKYDILRITHREKDFLRQKDHRNAAVKSTTLINILSEDMARLNVTEIFHDISFPGHLHTQDSLQLALKFQFQDTDVLIVSYPKSGKWRLLVSSVHFITSFLLNQIEYFKYFQEVDGGQSSCSLSGLLFTITHAAEWEFLSC